jgi:hypothetical protein
MQNHEERVWTVRRRVWGILFALVQMFDQFLEG